VTGRRPQPAAP